MTSEETLYSIDPNHPSLPGHFPGRPVVPGVVVLSELVPALRRTLGAELVITAIAAAKFTRPLLPGQPFGIDLEVGEGSARFRFEHDGQVFASGTVKFRLLPGTRS